MGEISGSNDVTEERFVVALVAAGAGTR